MPDLLDATSMRMMLESLTEIDIELKINEAVFAIAVTNNATASVLSFFNTELTYLIPFRVLLNTPVIINGLKFRYK